MEEIWKPIKGYEGLYEVSNIGRVKSLPKTVEQYYGYKITNERILKQSPDRKGYMMAWLYKNKKRNTVKVHRLVANAFIPNPDNKPQIDHINTVKDDNRVCNLRWCTEKENSNNPITAKRNGDAHRGAKSSSSVSVMQLNTNGDLVKIWECMSDIERELGFNHSHISQCCGGKKNVAYGFTWKYTDNG